MWNLIAKHLVKRKERKEEAKRNDWHSFSSAASVPSSLTPTSTDTLLHAYVMAGAFTPAETSSHSSSASSYSSSDYSCSSDSGFSYSSSDSSSSSSCDSGGSGW